MPLDPATIPEDLDQLRAKLSEMASLIEQQDSALVSLQKERDALEAERDHFKVAYEEAEAERQRLDDVFQKLLRRQSGPKSERLDPEQFQLALENVEQDRATATAAGEEAAAGDPDESRRRRPSGPWGTCPSTSRTTRSASSPRTRRARAAAGPCTRSTSRPPSACTSRR